MAVAQCAPNTNRALGTIMTQDRERPARDPYRADLPASDSEPSEGRTAEEQAAGGGGVSPAADAGVGGTGATTPPPETEAERRAGEDRRTRDEAVEEERRVEARRARDRQARERRQSIIDRVTLGVDYAFYLLYGLLGIRFILELLGAAETAGFVVFIRNMTDPFYAPFANIVARPSLNGGVLDFPLIIALLAYVLLHVAVRGLLRLLAGYRSPP
jgi:YggT family protein